MPLTEAEERAEHELRVKLMDVQIEENRVATQRLRQELKMETYKFILQAGIAAAALLATGVAIGRFWLFHS